LKIPFSQLENKIVKEKTRKKERKEKEKEKKNYK